MRKLGILTAFLFIGTAASAQVWFDFGLKAGANSSMLVNSNIFNDKLVVHEFTFGSDYGFRFGTNVGSVSEFTFEFGQRNMNQRWRMNDENGNKFWRDLDFDVRTMGLLYRLHKNGTYAEVGYEMNRFKRAQLSNEGESLPNDITYLSGDISPYITENYQSVMFGFGLYVVGNGNVSVIMGFRGSYAINDIINDAGGRGSNDPFPSEYTSYDSYQGTNPLTIGLFLELNYDIGYLVSPHCETRNAFILF